MVLKSALLLSLALVQLAVAATSVTIVNPKPKQVWHVGQVVEFKWTSKAADAPATNNGTTTKQKAKHHDGMVSIALATGPSQSLVIDRVIASNVNITKGSYKWKIPKNINTTKKYVIEIGPNASDIAFAGYVSIIKAPSTNGTSSAKPTKTTPPHSKPTQTIITTSKPTNKHEPTSVCVVVPNKNKEGSTVKCHPQPSHKKSQHPKKKKTSATATQEKPSTVNKVTHPPVNVATPSI
ncbi:hypothetical protein BCR42DRAFT_413169 [Absidia repens]|uniref:Yeast cell wall synthesis Kre9/Knh1-like N-terminal domain-containing protein n=1 Tax=Absidia repens TaxID=90262 RepID=A0A1X2IKR1_9FUNG|nr:hypothetical protein BCR42DRAFT_413169 [Absidia repens]